jgi:preprotein translocase subunit YajC
MVGVLAAIPIVFAQNAGAGAGNYNFFIVMGGMLVFFYMLLIRPQQQQEKKRRQSLDALKKNDRVLTTAGMYGTVVSVDHAADKVVLRVDDDKNVRITFSKTGINRVLDDGQAKDKEKEKEKADTA